MSVRWRTLDGEAPRVIAHRGASGAWPEHTLPAYEAALRDGADVLEPDLVISRDGTLVVRHDRGLARSTDIRARAAVQAAGVSTGNTGDAPPDWRSRLRQDDWPVDGFDRAELRALRAVQPFAERDHHHDGVHPVLDFDELLDWAAAQARERGAPLRLYPELKHPAAFARVGLDPVLRFIERVRHSDARSIALWVQCFEPVPLQRVLDATGLPCFLLIDDDADWRAVLGTLPEGVAGLGVAKSLLRDARGNDSGLVPEAHARGLQVHAWTYRDDVLPAGVASVAAELDAAFALGVDAVFCDFPATGLARRSRYASDVD